MIDVSDKILYNEIKAEKAFQTLINGAVSHELRNPLNSLICQIDSMLEIMQLLSLKIEDIHDNGVKV